MLELLLPQGVWIFLVTFVRVGAVMMVIPVFGEPFVQQRARLSLALLTSLVIAPIVGPKIPEAPSSGIESFLIIFAELTIGFFIGLTTRALMSALHFAGTNIATLSGLGFMMQFDPTQGQQSAMVSSFFSLIAMLLILAADLHHVMLLGMRDSYQIFEPGVIPPFADMAQYLTKITAQLIFLGLQLSFPFVVFGIVLNSSLGMVNRLMPQIQIMGFMLPLGIFFAFYLLIGILQPLMEEFIRHFEPHLMQFVIKPS